MVRSDRRSWFVALRIDLPGFPPLDGRFSGEIVLPELLRTAGKLEGEETALPQVGVRMKLTRFRLVPCAGDLEERESGVRTAEGLDAAGRAGSLESSLGGVGGLVGRCDNRVDGNIVVCEESDTGLN